MNPVDNPLTQIMQAFGAAPTDAAIAAFGITGEQSTSETDVTTRFAGYIESSNPVATLASGISLAGKTSENAQLIHAVPTDAAIAVDPTTALAPNDIKVHSLSASPTLLAGKTAVGDQITPEVAAAYSLTVNYRAAAPVALSANDLQALQSAAPAQIAALSASPVGTSATNPLGAIAPNPLGAQQGAEVPGQFLPASDLKFIFGETPTAPARQIEGTPALTANPVTNTSAPVTPVISAEHISTGHAVDPTVKPQAAIMSALASQPAQTSIEAAAINNTSATSALSDLSNNKAASLENGLEISRTNSAAAHASAQAAHAKMDAEPEPEADGQILAVTQKAQTAINAQAAAAVQPNNTPATAAQGAISTKQPTATANAIKSETPNKRGAENAADSREAPFSKAALAPANQQPIATTAPAPSVSPLQGTIDWTSPWITPERATGWPDGFATSLVSGGLGGLMGNQSGLTGMSMLGGQANPSLGSHVSKQLNLNMTRAVKAGEQEFSMRMDPPELGRVSVKLKFGQNGLVKSQIMAERPETLEMLQREIRGLERAIEAGGHKSEQGGISFSLDSGGQESAGKAFAEAMQQDRLKEELEGHANQQDDDFSDGDEREVEINLDEILAHVTPETGLDVRV